MKVVVVVAVIAATRAAHADATADVTKAFTAFLAGVAKGKPDLAGVEVFVPPTWSAAKPDAQELRQLSLSILTPRLDHTVVEVSKSGGSAWIYGEVDLRFTPDGEKQPIADTMRASAYLAHDAKGWHVRATHWSLAVKDQPVPSCGNMNTWDLDEDILPKEQAPLVKSVFDAIDTPKNFAAMMSDDKNAIAIGSAPGEKLTGAAIKKTFSKWQLQGFWPADAIQVRARAGGDGELAWIVMPVGSPKMCREYRTLFVLARESTGWRIVHQHYSRSTGL